MLGSAARRWAASALATITAFGISSSLALSARAVEAFDGRLQLHGFVEVQMRALSNDFAQDVDLAQWYNVLNLEFEGDIAPDGFGPMDLVEAFVRVEVRYDCVWTRGCGTMTSANTYGDRAQKVPQRFRNALQADYSGVIPPTAPGTYAVTQTPNSDAFGRTTDDVPRNNGVNVQNLKPKDIILTDIRNGEPVPAFPDPDGLPIFAIFGPVREVLGEDWFIHTPVPRQGIAGFATLFSQRGADNILYDYPMLPLSTITAAAQQPGFNQAEAALLPRTPASDDPSLYTFGSVVDVHHPYSWALKKYWTNPGGTRTQLIGPWRPSNKIQANALLLDRANPFRGSIPVMTGGYRGEDPLDPRLQELKDFLKAIGNNTAVPSLTIPRADDATGDSFAGDFSGVVPCVDPDAVAAEEARRGITPQSNCAPNVTSLVTGMPSFDTRDQELANVRIAFDSGDFGGGRFEIRGGGSGELPFRPAPDLSNLTGKSGNPGTLQAQGIYYPSEGLRRALASGEFNSLDFNYDQLERSFNRGQSQEQTGELKEAYLDIEWLDSRLWTRIGKQNIVWGKTELFRTTDQFNPQDLALASLPSLEESRIALWAFRAVYSLYNVGPLEDVRLEVAANFDEFQPADLGAAGEPFTPDLVGGLTTGIFFHSLTGAGVAGIDRPENPWDNIKGVEVGGRIEWRWDRFSFALTDFYGYDDFPYIDRIWTYDRNADFSTGRPLVGGLNAATAAACDSPVLDRDGDGEIDTTANPFDPTNPDPSIIDSKDPLSYTPLGIGGNASCLKGGGAAGYPNADPWFGGAENALENHYANQQIFAWICSTTVGIGAALDAGSCAWNIFGSPAPLAPGAAEQAFGEAVSAIASGDPDQRNRRLLQVVSANLRQTSEFGTLLETPLAGLNRDPGPLDPNCPTDPNAFSPFAECARWDGIITSTSLSINRSPGLPTSNTIFVSGELLTQVNGLRNVFGLAPLPPGPVVDGMPTGTVTSSCTIQVGANLRNRRFPDFLSTNNEGFISLFFPGLEPSLPGICATFLTQHQAVVQGGDLLTMDSTLTNFQKALLGCGAFFGTRCDSAVPIDALVDNDVFGSVDQINQEQAQFQEGGGLDFLNTDASALEQSWPGREGTAPLGAEANEIIYWTTTGQKRQPGTANVIDPSGIYEQGREFGPHCTRPDGEGGLVILPGCRGIESISVTRDPDTLAVGSVQIAFEDGYRPSVDGCLVGGPVPADAGASVIGKLGANIDSGMGGVDVTVVANSNDYTPDLDEIRQCHTDSTHNVGDYDTFSTEVLGSGWLWHPLAGCLSEDRARKVRNFGNTNVDPDALVENAQGNLVPATFGDCGTILVNGTPTNRSFINRFEDFNQDGILDIEQEFLGTLVRADCDLVVAGVCEPVPVATAQMFQNELAALSWNFMSFLVVTSCGEASEGQGNIRAKQECFNPSQALRADKCSFNAPHLCSNVKGFLGVAGVTRNDLRAGGNGRYGRSTFVWHSGGEIALRYQKRNVFGFSMDFAEDVTKSNWGVEFTWIEGLPFSDNNSATNISRSDVVNMTVSVDRPTFVNFLNANRTIFFNSQWFFQYVNDYKSGFTSNGPWNVLFTFAAFTGYFQDRLVPNFVSVFDVQSQSGGFLPNVAYRFTEAFSATIGVNIFFGRTQRIRMPLNEIAPVSNRAPFPHNERVAYMDGVDNVLSLVRQRDEFYLRLRWTF